MVAVATMCRPTEGEDRILNGWQDGPGLWAERWSGEQAKASQPGQGVAAGAWHRTQPRTDIRLQPTAYSLLHSHNCDNCTLGRLTYHSLSTHNSTVTWREPVAGDGLVSDVVCHG